jgi:hypothetical protein
MYKSTAVQSNTDTQVVKPLSEWRISEHGCQKAIMSDNNQPYAADLIKHLGKHL